MPDFIVTQTAREYSDFQKRKLVKLRQAVLSGFILFTLGCGFGYYTLWNMVHN